MAVRKATTTADLTDKPAETETVEVGYVRVTSPAGAVTTVPEEIVDALVESGYSKP